MEIIESIIKKDLNINLNLLDEKICFLDIETTGLNRNSDSIYLIGLVYYEAETKNWKIVQLLAEELKEEIDILLEAYRLVSSFDLIVNYNGDSFDIPFINNKLNFYRTNLSLDLNKSLDIYRVVQANKSILNLENYKLKTIEKYLGISRQDKFTGRECINFYLDYLVSKNSKSKDQILLHNYDDLYYLLDVIEIIDLINDKKTVNVNFKKSTNSFIIDNISTKKDYLFIKGKVDNNTIGKIVYFAENYKVIISNDNTFEMSIEIKEGLISPSQRCIFINAVDYDLPKKRYWSDQFNVPRGIVLLLVEKNYYIENLKMLIKELLDRIIS